LKIAKQKKIGSLENLYPLQAWINAGKMMRTRGRLRILLGPEEKN